MVRSSALASAAVSGVLLLLLAACSGGTVQTVGDAAALVAHHHTGSQDATMAIAAAGALGSRVAELAEEGRGSDPANESGGCRDGIEFFAPDRSGDWNSSETREFFDSGCRNLARDSVRRFQPNGPNSERVDVVTSIYAPGARAAIAVRKETSEISNATLGPWGFPIVRNGFAQRSARQLWVKNQEQSVTYAEMVALASPSGATSYCQDSAGYNAAGIPSLDAAFGWRGGTLASPVPTRNIERGGLVTLSSRQSGVAFAGPIGALSILAGRSNISCPIDTPAYGLAGGAPSGDFSMSVRVTYRHGTLWDLSVSEASFSGGYRLDVITTRGANRARTSVAGALTNGRTRIATLATDTFGDGELTITSTGVQYRMIDWTVVR
jgi:hypothetical protein